MIQDWILLLTGSSLIIAFELKLKSNLCGDYTVHIIIQLFLSLLCHHPIFFYLIYVNRKLFFFPLLLRYDSS